MLYATNIDYVLEKIENKQLLIIVYYRYYFNKYSTVV